jgi:hypothetical protein
MKNNETTSRDPGTLEFLGEYYLGLVGRIVRAYFPRRAA